MKQQLLHELLRAYEAVKLGFEPSIVQRGFIDWLEHTPGTTSSLATEALELAEADYKALAYLGYQSAIGANVVPAITKGCEWWVGRGIRRIDGEYQTFALDVIALFGIALAAVNVPDDVIRNATHNRILECLDANKDSFARDRQKSAFTDVCRGIISGDYRLQSTSAASTACPLLFRLGVQVDGLVADAAIAEICESFATTLDGFEAALNSFSMRTLLRQTAITSLNRPTVSEILAVLENIEAGLLRWPYGHGRTSTWEVSNEYDVQAMLYLILKSLIPELKEEEWLSSIGTKKPRADLAVLSLRLLIEVKFVRRNDSFNGTLGQISEDKGFYLRNGSPYSHLLVFVWDNSRRTEQHASFKQGVAELGLDGAVVVSRPSLMTKS